MADRLWQRKEATGADAPEGPSRRQDRGNREILSQAAILAAALASLAALAVAGGGVASAATGSEIINMGLAENGHGACLTAQAPPGTAITQEQCTNAGNQQWVYIGTPAQNNPIQIQNVGTGQCMDVSAFSDAAPVVQVSCAIQAIGSYWNRNILTVAAAGPMAAAS